ncbi:CapA family protein [Mucilaginibacter sp. RS28]|uniref:CapA family protein n=1 Tax=Mucilaginibacter straminoryzae TaxID=2932774 RepID=A0A9X2B9Z2_9SPHI|nr:CapA family protein [Mucilaginibacter straminoryzae]MCJ8208232.1 CapA family protein [Mucilaginibacter straminoryzae]
MKFLKLLQFVVVGLCWIGCQHQLPPVQHKNDVGLTVVAPVVTAPADELKIVAVGDMMLGTSYPDSSALPPDSAVNSFNAAVKELQSADVTFGNLEGTLLNEGEPASFKLHQRSKAYLFRMPEAYGKILSNAGFDLLSLGNNHSNDFDLKGRKSTARVLDSCGIAYAGLLSCPVTTIERNGITYGFCAFSPNSTTVSLLNLKHAAELISSLKQRCDIVIVSFHGGGEGVDFEHVTRMPESYFGEPRGDVYAFAHAAVDAGADLVFGNGPHVNRGMELYKNRLIAYSLGNFCTYKSVSIAGICGLAPLLKVSINKNGEFAGGQIISFKQDHQLGLRLDAANKAALRIKQLTETDFPDGGLNISDEGVISRKTEQMAGTPPANTTEE